MLKIEKNTVLSLYDLLTPIENNRTLKVPRPQNSFVIYRRNLQAKMAISQTTCLERLDKVSKIAGTNWKVEPKEVRDLFTLIADCAKKVHSRIYPGYVYNPKRSCCTKASMTPANYRALYNLRWKNLKLSSPFPQNYQNEMIPSSQNLVMPHFESILPKKPFTPLEITPNFMNSYDNDVRKVLNKNMQDFFH
ncbi:20026_t:CDS:1 [Funneliformis geosporum]|uniref:16742_t:CDS:1 n=1 Tax=Funneliformis geosporum TaxID=1117311 RepID=A0A9W4SDU7_9GLOM|nr:16742_t:CDS:1 [Funneliformis geosporum]CAI2178953.1 20026_t:CDS:1 [Funneliformis geosporum]